MFAKWLLNPWPPLRNEPLVSFDFSVFNSCSDVVLSVELTCFSVMFTWHITCLPLPWMKFVVDGFFVCAKIAGKTD